MKEGFIFSFQHFLNRFPETELPVTLSEDTLSDFNLYNEPITEALSRQFIERYEKELPDEFTEYVPCLKVPGTKVFHALVYWKAGLMTYEYILATYTPAGLLIDKKPIAGTIFDGHEVKKSVATITEGPQVVGVEGIVPLDGKEFSAASSKSYLVLLKEDGKIVI